MLDSDDLYEILQVHPAADPDIIQAAYKRLALRYHPDRNKAPDAAEVMKRLNHAYEVLRDPARRQAYDRDRTLRGRLGAGGHSQSGYYRTTGVDPESSGNDPRAGTTRSTSPGAGPYGHTRAPGARPRTGGGSRSDYSSTSPRAAYREGSPSSERAQPASPASGDTLGSRLRRELTNIPVTFSSVAVVSLGLLALVTGIIAILFVGGGSGSGQSNTKLPGNSGPEHVAALPPATAAPTRTLAPTPTPVLGLSLPPTSTLGPTATARPAASPTPAAPPLRQYVHPEGRWRISYLEGQEVGGPWLVGDVEVVEFATPGAGDALQVYRFVGEGAKGGLQTWAFDRAASRDDNDVYEVFKLTSMEEVSVGGYPAYQAGYLMQTSSLTSTAVALLLFAGDDAYEVVGSISIDRWNEVNETIRGLVRSFQPSP